MSAKDEACDVVVVGAGPAGSVVAGILVERGHSVVLCDRYSFPRTKACGESINPGAVRELRRLGLLDRVLDEPHRRVRGWRVSGAGDRVFEGHFPGAEAGIGMSRSRFDAVLLDWAVARGVLLRAPEKVVELMRDRGAVSGVVTAGGDRIAARLVIGADGLRSVVVRRLGLIKRMPRLRKIALTAHMQTPAEGELGELRTTAWGCAGIAPIGNSLVNVVLVLSSRGPAADQLGAAGPAELFDRLAMQVPSLQGGLRTGRVSTTGPFDFPTRSIVADGALLVGDAAGYFDPFTGQGIYRALRGASMAAEAADHCLQKDDCRAPALAPYERAHVKAFRSGVLLQHLIESVVSRPRLFGGAASVLATLPTLADRLVSVTGDEIPVRALLLPRL